MTDAQKIAKLQDVLKMGQAAFAESIGYSQGAISHIISDGRALSLPMARKISDKHRISLQWLLTGEGEMLPQSQSTYFNAKDSKAMDGIHNMVIVPLKAFGGFLTGYANKIYLDSLERINFPFVRGECFAFEVEGFSMINEDKDRSYTPGSFVVCTALESLQWMTRERDYVFQTVEGIILKAFVKIEGEHCYLRSLNKDYEPIKVHMKKIKNIYHIEYKIAKP